MTYAVILSMYDLEMLKQSKFKALIFSKTINSGWKLYFGLIYSEDPIKIDGLIGYKSFPGT